MRAGPFWGFVALYRVQASLTLRTVRSKAPKVSMIKVLKSTTLFCHSFYFQSCMQVRGSYRKANGNKTVKVCEAY